VIDLVEERAWFYSGDRDAAPEERPVPPELQDAYERARDRLIEKVAEEDEQLMISYVEGRHVTVTELKKALRRTTLNGSITPSVWHACATRRALSWTQSSTTSVTGRVPPVTGTIPTASEAPRRRPQPLSAW
jgi:elongation factor G